MSADAVHRAHGRGAPGRARPPELGANVFAGMLMILVGTFHTVQGLVAVVNDDFYLVRADALFGADLVAWGWFHLTVGVAAVLAGGAAIGGVRWAAPLVNLLAGLSIMASFLWLPHYPLWSVVIVAFDVFVVWALTAPSEEAQASPVVHD